MSILTNDWADALNGEFEKPYYRQLMAFLEEEYQTAAVYPAMNHIFTALNTTPLHKVKVVILGQDPYHGPNQSHGLAFSVLPGTRIPPSLRNIYKELQADVGIKPPGHGYLLHWAEEGVLLLNTVLTVRAGEAGSHRRKGWERFTDQIIHTVNLLAHPVVFILWGNPAQSKLPMIDTSKHHIITSAHPSPLSASRGFLGSRPFSRTNHFLIQNKLGAIDWEIPEMTSN